MEEQKKGVEKMAASPFEVVCIPAGDGGVGRGKTVVAVPPLLPAIIKTVLRRL